MDLLKITGTFMGMIAFGLLTYKYYLAFTYERTFDPFLKGKSFVGDFLFSFSHSGYKMRYCMPWFWRNSKAEEFYPELRPAGRKIHVLCIAFICIFIGAVIIMAFADSSSQV
jgi:hypothetical protein